MMLRRTFYRRENEDISDGLVRNFDQEHISIAVACCANGAVLHPAKKHVRTGPELWGGAGLKALRPLCRDFALAQDDSY